MPPLNMAYPIVLALLCIVGSTILCVVLLWVIDPYERDLTNHVVVLFTFGASVPPLLTRLAEAGFGLPTSIFPALLQRYALSPLSVWSGLIEEAAKALMVLGAFALLRRQFDDALDGAVVGAIVGAGFALAQALVYVQDLAPVAQIARVTPDGLLALAAAGLSQCVFTSLFGACLGYAREMPRGRWGVPIVGFAAAAVYHMAYIGLGTLATTAGGVAPAAGIARALADWTGPVLVIALMIWAWARERDIFRQTLTDEVATGAVTPSELTCLTVVHRFGWWMAPALGRATSCRGPRGLSEAQASLAFAKWHRRRGIGSDDEVSNARDRIRQVRGELGGQPT